MISMVRKPPIRCQAMADSFLASSSRGLVATADRDLRAALGCADIPMDCLSLDQDFVVVNKPTDVRMSGDFNVTVHKLIRHWCPSLAERDLKWVHQLDFATSGVLCVALHRDAAARACEAFRERRSDKAYIAVLEGVVDAAAVPRREDKPAGWGEGEEGDGAATGRKNRPNAVQHMPAHGFFQRKKDRLLTATRRGETLSNEDIAFASTKWADIKHDKEASKSFFAAAQADKARAIAAIQEVAFNAAQGAPDRGVFRAPGDGPETFRVDASVSEIPGDFRMRLDDGPGGGGKACKTIVEVLERGSYKGQAVTKVLLRPHTGRRHQLRLHTLHIGHPILGDATYAGDDDRVPRMCLHAHSLRLQLAPPAPAGTEGDAKEERNGLRHKGRPARCAGDRLEGDEAILEVSAPDPFIFVDGELQLQHTAAMGRTTSS